MSNTNGRAELIKELRLLAQISGGNLVTQAADLQDLRACGRCVCVECNTHIEAQQVVVPVWTIAAERVPLSDEAVEDLRGDANRGFNIEREDYFKAFRDAEKAHNIKES